MRDWLSTRLFWLAGTIAEMAERVEPERPRCIDCGIGEPDGECEVCAAQIQENHHLASIYDEGHIDGYREAEHRFAGPDW